MDVGDFRLMDRKAVGALKRMRERHRFMRGMSVWVGFRQTGVSYVRAERYAGETKYPFNKMLRFALDGITSFSYFPLQIATYAGFVIAGIAVSASSPHHSAADGQPGVLRAGDDARECAVPRRRATHLARHHR
jgi:dolichol-phosphate mannosyltransferase